MVGSVLTLCLIVILVRKFIDRHTPQIGGKLGRRRTAPRDMAVPHGFSDVVLREIRLFGARTNDARYASLKTFLRHGTFERTELMRIYRVAACNTRIEIPAVQPDYERIDVTEALALLRELPDPRMIRRLHLCDEPSFLDPWLRHVSGREIQHLGNATTTGIVVLYRPDRRHSELAVTLLHEWLHLVAFKSRGAIRRFKRAHTVEPLAHLPYLPLSAGNQWALDNEIWSELGERVVGADHAVACQAALAAPLHSMVIWEQIETIIRNTPSHFASTRLFELEARGAFMRDEVSPIANAALHQKRPLIRAWKEDPSHSRPAEKSSE
jgi:hypothetical protein